MAAAAPHFSLPEQQQPDTPAARHFQAPQPGVPGHLLQQAAQPALRPRRGHLTQGAPSQQQLPTTTAL